MRAPLRRGLAASAMAVTAITLVSRITGFLRETVIAAVFGAGDDVDRYLVAQSIPNVVIALIATAVVTSMVPTLSARVAAGDRAGADRTFGTLATMVLLALVPGTALLAWAAPAVVAVLAPGFDEVGRAATVGLTRTVLLATIAVAAANLLTGLLHAHGRLVWPSLEGLPFNAVMIAATLLLGATLGIEVLAAAFVVGSVARLGLQLLGLRGTGVRLRPSLDRREPGVATALSILPTVVLSHVIANVNNVVDRVAGSALAAGSIAALGFGHRLVALPQGLLAQSLIVVLYPSLNRRLATEGPAAAADLLRRGSVTLAVVLLPVASLLAVEAEAAVRLVYARGSFDAEDVALTSAAVRAFAPGLVLSGIRDLALRGLYSVGDRSSPLVAAGVGAAVNVAGNLVLGPRLGVAGIALATTLSQLVSMVLAVRALRHRLPADGKQRSRRPWPAVAGAGALGLLTMAGMAAVMPEASSTGHLIGRLAAVGVVGGAVQLAVLLAVDRTALADLRALPGPWRR